MAVGGRKPEEGWISSLEAIARESEGNDVDQARLTATYSGAIFAERRKKEPNGGGGASSSSSSSIRGRRELPRFFMPHQSAAGTAASLGRNSGSCADADATARSEDSRVAAARSNLRAKARSRFLQRREEALMGLEDLSEVERALASCVAPEPSGGVPPPPPRPPPVEFPAPTGSSSINNGTSQVLEPGSARISLTRGRLDGDREERVGEAAGSTDGLSPLAEENGVAVRGGSGDSGGDDSSPGGSGAAAGDLHTGTDAHGGSADYMDFVRLRGLVSRKAAAFFKSRTFLRFPRDIRARIPSRTFFKHVFESVTLQKIRLTLHFYDSEGLGSLREQDLENYVYDHIPTIPALRSIHDNFYPFYVFTAVRRFMFFLDPRRTGKISIDTLVRSRIMEELLQLRMAAVKQGEAAAPGGGGDPGSQDLRGGRVEHGAEQTASGAGSSSSDGRTLPGQGSQQGSDSKEGGDAVAEGGGGGDGDNSVQDLSKNWFSAESTLRVYGEYLELDDDQNGMLSKQELMNFGSRQRARLTPVFVQRLFEEVVTYRVQPPPSSPSSRSPPAAADREDTPILVTTPSSASPGGGGGVAGDADADLPAKLSLVSPPPRIWTGVAAVPASAAGGTGASPPSCLASPPPSPSPQPPATSSAAPTATGSPPASGAAVATTPPSSRSLACPIPRTTAASRSSLLALSSTSGGMHTPSPTRSVSPGGGGDSATAVAAGSPPYSPGGGGIAGASAVAGGGAGGGERGGRKGRGGAGEEAQMDYKTFLDLVLAMDNKQTRQAMHYFWRVLDVQGEGRLTIATIHLFFRDVARALEEGGFETPNIDDVQDEIFDMVKPADPNFITLADLLASGAGHTVVSMLVDTNGFWTYDNRESLAT